MTNLNQVAAPAGVRRSPRLASKPALIGIGGLLVMLTNAIVFLLPPLLPIIQEQYGLATVAQTTWLYTALTLGGGASFILLPRIADVHGDRNAAVIASAFLAVGAFIPAVGDSYPALLIGSVVMGFGGAAQLLPLGFLRRNLGESGLPIAIAVLVIATGFGVVAGMIGGGLTLEHLSLRAIFLILTAAGIVATVASFRAIPHLPPAEPAGRIGALGTVWLVGWVAALLLAMTQGLVWGLGALIPLVVGVVGGVAWVRVERRSTAAVFDATVLRAPFVVTASTCVGLFAAVNAAFLLLLSDYAQVVPSTLPIPKSYGLGLSAVQTGLLMLPFALTFLVGSVIADGPVNRGKGGPVLMLGALTCAVGFVFLAFAHQSAWQYLVGAAVIGLGCSIGYAAGFTLVQLAVPDAKAGMAAGVAGTAMAVGFAFGTALITAVLSASVIAVAGSTTEVAAESLYGASYWVAAVLAGLIVVTVSIARRRAARAARGAIR